MSSKAPAKITAVWLLLTAGRYPFSFEWATPLATLLWLVYAAGIVVASIFYLRRRGTDSCACSAGWRAGNLSETPEEVRLFQAVALLSGVEEEVVYRWFLMSYLTDSWSAGLLESVVLSGMNCCGARQLARSSTRTSASPLSSAVTGKSRPER